MIRKIKTTAVILSFALAFSGVCGCENGDVNINVNINPNAGEKVSENVAENEDEEAAINELAIKGPSYTGLSSLTVQNNEDGTYVYEDMTEDGITVITNECYRNSQRDGQAPDAYAQNFVCAIIDNDAKVTEVKEEEILSSSLTYPTYRVYWESGSNEDSRQAVGAVVLTDNFTYYYGFKCSVDYYEDNADLYEEELNSIELIALAAPEAGPETDTDAEATEKDYAEASEGDNEYGALYTDKINELKSEGMADQFTLARIDEDDSPELIASDSQGSYDHENAFIFTTRNDEVVLLASVIAGVDGGSLDYKNSANLIHVSGAAAGMRDVFYHIKYGALEEAFTAEATSMEEDAEYSINGTAVEKDEYYEKLNSFMEEYNPLTRIACDGLYEVNYTYEDGYGYFEQGNAQEYDMSEEISK